MAAVQPMSATPSFPPDRLSAMIPEPMMTASNPAVPRNSAAMRRENVVLIRAVFLSPRTGAGPSADGSSADPHSPVFRPSPEAGPLRSAVLMPLPGDQPAMNLRNRRRTPRRRTHSAFLLGFLLAAPAEAPAATQDAPIFTDDFPAWEFAERRQAVMDAIGPGTIALIQGAPSPDGATGAVGPLPEPTSPRLGGSNDIR